MAHARVRLVALGLLAYDVFAFVEALPTGGLQRLRLLTDPSALLRKDPPCARYD